LGLPIAKWIAEKLGGTLEVQSVFGRGSTFTLRIATGPLDGVPWIAPPEEVERTGTPLPKAGHKSPCRLQGRVLLAEDAGDIRKLIEYALRRCGVEVTAVENGRQAVEAATRDAFDLILMDIRMPELDGLSAAVELRRRGCRATIIALTASTSDRERDRILASGFDDFWSKPISLDDLVERVAMYLPSREGSIEDQVVASGPHGKPSLKGSRAFELPGVTTGDRMAAAVAEFAASLPVRAGAIRAAVEGGDLPRARDLLHQLVGSSGIHGFMSISHETARLLQILKNPTIAIGPAELRSLEDMIARL
jgi:CheY-like chemotaxis protein